MKQTDTLIIGQGIAGSLVAFMLHQKKIPFLVMDPGFANTASRVATGMFTPISGKRKVIAPFIMEQIPFAINVYKEIEKLLNKRFLHLQNVYDVPAAIEERNDINKKLVNEDYAKYILSDSQLLPGIKQEFGVFEITNSGWLDCALFTDSFKNWLKENDMLLEEEFIYERLRNGRNGLRYKEIEFKKIIFCEGYRAFNNPFFSDDDIIPCKGDVLTIEYKDGPANSIIKKNTCYLIASGGNTFKAGSTYKWHNSNEKLEDGGKKEITDKLDTMLVNEYTVINHQSAIRPTTLNREVIVRQHPDYPQLFMLNGLGTKGVIQGPWWANYLVSLLEE